MGLRLTSGIKTLAVTWCATAAAFFGQEKLHAQANATAEEPGIARPLTPEETARLARNPKTNSGAASISAVNGLLQFYSAIGKVSLSVDGVGTNSAEGIVEVEKPAGATVRVAYLAAASNFTRLIANGDVSLGKAGGPYTPLTWEQSVVNDLPAFPGFFNSVLANVTPIVKPIVDAAPAGRVAFGVTEVGTFDIDGEILVVVFDNPSEVQDNTIILLFGGLLSVGDNFNIALAEPIDLDDPNSRADMGLGISFGFQGSVQYSQIDVNSVRLTTSAGGQDDGVDANGALLTVGGLDDSFLNPPDPFALPTGPRSDDELYNLKPFIDDGDLLIHVNTFNPSDDDNIFFGWFRTSAPAILGEGITLSPVADTNEVNSNHTFTARVQDDNGDPVVGRQVRFQILGGPHAPQIFNTVTDNQGRAFFTYFGTTTGTDTLQAFADAIVGHPAIASNLAYKTWIETQERPCLWLPDTSRYGRIQNGDQSHEDKVCYCFEAVCGDVYLYYRVYDIDFQGEVEVFLNGKKIGVPDTTPARTWSGERMLVLPGRLLREQGPNELCFDNLRNPPKHFFWGVQVLRMEIQHPGLFPLPHMAELGLIPGGDQTHEDKVEYSFPGQTGDVYVSYQVYDIDNANELDIFVNGKKVKDEAPTADASWSQTRVVLLPDSCVNDSACNVLTFDNTRNPPKHFVWGVRKVDFGHCIPLPHLPAVGKIKGGDQKHVNQACFTFEGLAGDNALLYEVYDIDNINEVDVYLNGVKIKDEAVTPDEAWSPRRALLLPDALVNDFLPNEIVFDNTVNPPKTWNWGVRNLEVAIPVPPNISSTLEDPVRVSGRGLSGTEFLADGVMAVTDREEDAPHVDQLTTIAQGGELMIELPAARNLNYLMIVPQEGSERIFSYHLEASADGKSWATIVDMSNDHVQGVQIVHLSGTPVSALRLSGSAYVLDMKALEREDMTEAEYAAAYAALVREASPVEFGIREITLFHSQPSDGKAPVTAAQPAKFNLAQNYPNPFSLSGSVSGNGRQQTMIRYELPEATQISIRVYDALGRHIRTLVDGMQSAGAHQAHWNGRDKSGHPVAAGLYIYRMEAGNFVTQRTLLLTK